MLCNTSVQPRTLRTIGIVILSIGILLGRFAAPSPFVSMLSGFSHGLGISLLLCGISRGCHAKKSSSKNTYT